MADVLRTGALVAAAMTMGIMAGVFQLYSYAIMPGLRRLDDRPFIAAFQSIDRAILNPLFLATFFGALAFTGVSAWFHLGADERPALPWIAAAFCLYAATVGITLGINVPLNDAIKAAGGPDRLSDPRAVRRNFDEARWVRMNHVRAVLSTTAFGCLAWALVVHGRP